MVLWGAALWGCGQLGFEAAAMIAATAGGPAAATPSCPTMSRKPKKGYLSGKFVAEGSKPGPAVKPNSKALRMPPRPTPRWMRCTDAGRQSCSAARRPVCAPEPARKLQDALAEAKRITNFEGKRRRCSLSAS